MFIFFVQEWEKVMLAYNLQEMEESSCLLSNQTFSLLQSSSSLAASKTNSVLSIAEGLTESTLPPILTAAVNLSNLTSHLCLKSHLYNEERREGKGLI